MTCTGAMLRRCVFWPISVAVWRVCLARSENADSSSQVVLNGSSRREFRESGRLNGRATMRPDGTFKPSMADTSGAFNDRLYNIVFRSPTPWPHTGATLPDDAAAEADAADYQRALAYITENLPQFKG
jgi:hypothetical protein